jgi:hypothetical protein
MKRSELEKLDRDLAELKACRTERKSLEAQRRELTERIRKLWPPGTDAEVSRRNVELNRAIGEFERATGEGFESKAFPERAPGFAIRKREPKPKTNR